MTIHIQEVVEAFLGKDGEVKVASSNTLDAGSIVRVNSSGEVVLADADFVSNYAQAISLAPRAAGEAAVLARRCKVYDDAAGFTINSPIYLSTTSGGYTQTRPTGVGDLRQVIGFAYTTKYAEFNIPLPQELMVPLIVKGATSAFAQLDSGDFGGPTLDAQNEVCLLQAEIPENAVAVTKAVLRVAAEATAGTPTADISISAHGGDDTAWDAITADTTLTNQATEGSAADSITEINLLTGLDATSIFRPGNTLGIKVTKDDAGTDVIHVLGGYLIVRVV